MHIVIYGVGRSGTKAVQLYLSYLLAQIEGKVWINYEPHFWLDRKTKAMNFEGFHHHLNTPHLIDNSNQISKSHHRYLQKLGDHKHSIVTKFIRANGRIDAINNILNPDYNFIIIRNLYQVLTSVLKAEWDFWSVGWDYHVSWEKFLHEVRQNGIVENFDWCLNQINDRTDQNAFYWYVMNLAALKVKSKKTFIIDYREISKVEEIAKNIFGDKPKYEPISNEKFNGDNIHFNYPLASFENFHFIRNLSNILLYKTRLTDKFGLYIPQRKIGSKAVINSDYYYYVNETKGTKVVIEKKDLFEFFNEDIAKRFSAKMEEK